MGVCARARVCMRTVKFRPIIKKLMSNKKVKKNQGLIFVYRYTVTPLSHEASRRLLRSTCNDPDVSGPNWSRFGKWKNRDVSQADEHAEVDEFE